jgi:hypothetical protein
MEGEDVAIAPTPELETPAIEQEAQTEATVPDEPERILDPGEVNQGDEAGAEVAEPEIETFEIEWDDGNKYVIPKALEGGILKNKDYTTKTQEAAAIRKQLESREAEITQMREATEAELDARAELQGVTARLGEYAKLTPQDWQTHMLNDPLGTQQAQLELGMLKDRRAELEGTLSKSTAERTEKAQQDLAKRVQDTLAEAPKIIPGWKAETANDTIKELVTFAQSEGIPDQVLQDLWSPTLLKLIHRARVGSMAMNRPATPKPAPASVTPLRTIAGKSSPTTSADLGSADMDAYVAARKRGVGGKALR